MTRDRQGATAFEVARQIFTEFAHADLFSFHFVYSLYAIVHRGIRLVNWQNRRKLASKEKRA